MRVCVCASVDLCLSTLFVVVVVVVDLTRLFSSCIGRHRRWRKHQTARDWALLQAGRLGLLCQAGQGGAIYVLVDIDIDI